MKESSMEIRALIGKGAITCVAETTLREAAERMIEEGVGSLGVLESDLLAGIITERDILRAVAGGAQASDESVGDWLTPRPDVMDPDVDVTEAAQWMLATGYRHLPVVDGNRLLGIASIKDVLWALSEPSGAGAP